MDVTRAIGFMVFAMLMLAFGDAFVKLSTRHAPLGQVLLALGLGGFVLFGALAVWRRERLFGPAFWHPLVLLRHLFEMIGAFGMILGLAFVPLTVMAAIMQAAPLLVTLGAALILRERVGLRRWIAVAVGLAGMLIVIRPFGSAFTGWEIFAVLGVGGLAARDLVTRVMPDHISTLFVSVWGILTLALPGLVLLLVTGEDLALSPDALWPLGGAVLLTCAGYLSVTVSMRMAPASVVAPFRYTRLVFATALGMLVFAERPDPLTWLGASLILGAGLYAFLREARLQRR